MLTLFPESTSVQRARPFPTQTSVSRTIVAEYQDEDGWIAGKGGVHHYCIQSPYYSYCSAGDSSRKGVGSSRGKRSDGAQLWQGGQLPENTTARSRVVSTWLVGRRKTSELCLLSHQCNRACRAGLSVSILQECLVLGASQATMNGLAGNKAQPQTRSQPSLHGRGT